MNRRLMWGLLLGAAAAILIALNQGSPLVWQPPITMTPDPEPVGSTTLEQGWNAFVEQTIEDYFAAHPAFAAAKGRHEYDGLLPDWSREGIARENQRQKTVRERALAFPESELSNRQKFEREYLVAVTDRDLFWREAAGWPYKNPSFYLDFLSDSLDPAHYLTLDYAPLEQRMAAFTRYARNLVVAAQQIRDNIAGPVPRTYARFGYDSFNGYASFFENDVPAVFAGVSDAALQQEFAAANAQAVAAMSGLAAHFQSLQATGNDDYALGNTLFSQMLYDAERVDISLDALDAIGRADLARNQAALAEACGEFAPGESIPGCIQKMTNRKAPGGVVAGARAQLAELRAFLDTQELVSIPGSEIALVRESPPICTLKFSVHHDPRSLRKKPAFDLLHFSARPALDRSGTAGLHSRGS